MSADKQNIDNELAMAILNGLSGPNACKVADERRRTIPLHIADQAVKACEDEIQRLRDKMFVLTCKGAAMAGYLQAIAESQDMMPDQGELQRLLKKSISEWDGAVEDAGWKGGKR